MKRKYLINGLVTLVAFAAVIAGYVGTYTYTNFQRQIRWHEGFAAVLDRIYYDQMVSSSLKSIKQGDIAGAAQRLDITLCGDILRLNAELVDADGQMRRYVEGSLRQMARIRPKTAELPNAGEPITRESDQYEAEKILTLVANAEKPAR